MRFNGGPIPGNQFFLDGGMNTVPAINEISVVPMVDAVAEFRVETSGMKAEFGQTSGGVVNVVTKSGSQRPLIGMTGKACNWREPQPAASADSLCLRQSFFVG